jgi:hypothetical protein
MKNLYDRAAELIEKPDDHPLFLALVKDARKLPSVTVREVPLPLSRMFLFSNLYLAFFVYPEGDSWIIRGATMSLEGGSIDSALSDSLGGCYPFGIAPKDDQQTIHRKIGLAPVKAYSRVMAETEIWREEYDLPSLELDLHFNSQGGELLFWLVSRKGSRAKDSSRKTE